VIFNRQWNILSGQKVGKHENHCAKGVAARNAS
jgi:hypothetical protein